MTERELSQLYYINKEIKALQLELAELRQKNFYKPNIIFNRAKGEGKREPSLEYIGAITELESMINLSLLKLQRQRGKVLEYLESIEDNETRIVIRLRAVNNMKWEDIGRELNMDRRTASRKYYHFLKDARNTT